MPPGIARSWLSMTPGSCHRTLPGRAGRRTCLTPHRQSLVSSGLNRFAKPVSRHRHRRCPARGDHGPVPGAGSPAVDRGLGAAPEVDRGGADPRRPRIADVAREAGVSKTAVSFAFNSPDRLAPETAEPDPRRSPISSATGPHPVARMLTQRADADDRRAHAAGAVGHLLQPVLRGVQRGRRARGRGGRATRSTSSRRCTAAWPGR